jgi:hypothetical protein
MGGVACFPKVNAIELLFCSCFRSQNSQDWNTYEFESSQNVIYVSLVLSKEILIFSVPP